MTGLAAASRLPCEPASSRGGRAVDWRRFRRMSAWELYVDAAQAEALVALRGQLEEAIRRSADPTVVGRRVAAVLLDGAAEAAIGTCLAAINITPPDNSLEDAYSRLVDALKQQGLPDAYRFPGWPDVRRLRRVRNDAQHHQIPPDHTTLVNWTASVQRFVEALVEKTFGEPLSLIARSAVIRDPELREGFESAEEAQLRGDSLEVVRAVERTFRAARSKWEAEQRDATGHMRRR